MDGKMGDKFNAESFSPEQLGVLLLKEASELRPDHEKVRAMIKAGAVLDRRDDRGNTPLILFMQHRHFDIAKDLIEADADVTVRNKLTNTAMIFSEVNNRRDLSEMMRAKGGRIRPLDPERIKVLKTAGELDIAHVAMFVQSAYENIHEREEAEAAKTRKMTVVHKKDKQP